MEPLMIPNDLNVDVQSKDFLSHSHEQFQQHIPSISSRKRALHECTTESVRPRKIRRCNTAPPNAPPVQHDAIDDDDDQKYDDEQRQSSLSLSSSLSSPTVTILSGCGEAAAAFRPSNCNENIHRSAPAHLRCDNHHSNVLLSTNKTNNEAQCIDINTGVTESLMDVVPESTLNSAHKEAEKCGFSMTMQTEPTPPTVFVKSEHDENIDDNDMKSPPPPDVRNSSADTVDIDQVDNDDDRKHMDEIEPMQVKQGEQHDFEASNDDSFDYEGRVIRLVRLLLDAKRVGGLIGKAGNSITRIRSESQAKILITRAVPHSLFRVCSIEGDCDAIVRGMCLIVDKIAEETTRSPPYQITILVEEKNIGCLIGKGGEAITEIRADTLANIYISSHLLRNSTEKTVDIYGECNQVHEAIKMVVTRLCSNAAFAPTRQSYNPQLDGMSQLQSESQSQSHSPSTRGWRNSNSNSNQCSSSSRNNNDDHRSAMIPGACVNNNNMSSSLPAVTPLSSALNTHAQNAMLTAASALHNSLGSSCALNQLYPYNYNLNSSALQSRLLQFPPLNYSRLGAMQPQIITSAPTHCNANLSPICSSRYRQPTFSQQQSLLHTNNGTPFAAAAFSVPQPQESIPVPTTTTSVISPLSAQKNDPNSTITSNNPNPYLLSPHLSNFSPQRIETNTFVNSHSHSNSATPLSTADMQTHSNRNSNHSNSNSNMEGERNRNPAVFQQQQAAAAHCHALDHSLSANQTAHRNNDNHVHMNKQIPMISTSFRSPLPSGLYYNARVIGTVSPVSSSRSNSGMAAHSPPVNNAMILSSSSGVDSVVLTVASHLIGGVIGKGGRNIQDIRRQSGAEIKIDNERQNPTPNRYITIKGTKQQIANAASLIKNSVSPHMATSSNW